MEKAESHYFCANCEEERTGVPPSARKDGRPLCARCAEGPELIAPLIDNVPDCYGRLQSVGWLAFALGILVMMAVAWVWNRMVGG